MSYELCATSYELHFVSYELNFMSYELHFMSYISDRRCKLKVARCGCRMQMQVAYKYGSFVHLGKVKKIRNLGCSCPGSDLFFLSRDSDRGLGCSERTCGK